MIVVCIDNTPASTDALMWAVDQAVLERRRLAIAHVIDGATERPLVPAFAVRSPASARDLVTETTTAAVRDVGDQWLRSATYDESAADSFCLPAGARMVVFGSGPHPCLRGPASRAVAATELARRSPVPVLTVRGWRSATLPGRVVVVADPTPAGSAALTFGFAQARRRAVPLTALSCPHATEDSGRTGGVARLAAERMAIADRLATFRARHIDVDLELRIERPAIVDRLIEQSLTADLVVVGTDRHDDNSGLSPDDVCRLLRETWCTVAIVPVSAAVDLDRSNTDDWWRRSRHVVDLVTGGRRSP